MTVFTNAELEGWDYNLVLFKDRKNRISAGML
jgi:hypothetical protein